jgi:hypothetical protein
LVNFSSELVEGGFFDVELESLDILVVLAKVQSKCMMRCKGKGQVKESSSLTKVTQRQKHAKAKKIQKMLQWI